MPKSTAGGSGSWVRAGKPTLAVSLVWMLLLLGKGIGAVGNAGLLLLGLQMVPFLAAVPAAERALKRKFDRPERKIP